MSGMVTSVAGVCSMVCNSLVVEHGIDGVVALQHPCHPDLTPSVKTAVFLHLLLPLALSLRAAPGKGVLART